MYSEFAHASKVQTCSVCTEHPSSAQAWIVHHLLFVFWSVETTQKDAWCVQMFNAGIEPCAYTEFNCVICRYALYVVMTLRSSDYHSHLNSAERRGRDMDKIKSSKETRSWTEICIHCACISVLSQQRGLFLWSPHLDPQNCLGAVGARQEFERTKECLGTVLTRFVCKNDPYINMLMTSTFCQWYSVSMSASMVCFRRPMRFEWIYTVPIIDCVHTPGDCTRAHSMWCTSNHPRVAWPASTPSHLLHSGPVSKMMEEATCCVPYVFNLGREPSVLGTPPNYRKIRGENFPRKKTFVTS